MVAGKCIRFNNYVAGVVSKHKTHFVFIDAVVAKIGITGRNKSGCCGIAPENIMADKSRIHGVVYPKPIIIIAIVNDYVSADMGMGRCTHIRTEKPDTLLAVFNEVLLHYIVIAKSMIVTLDADIGNEVAEGIA